MKKSDMNSWTLAAVILALIVAGSSSVTFASEDGDQDPRHKRIVRKIVINCEEGSEEDCEQQIRVESISDDSHILQIGDHQSVWVDGGPHGSHYAFRTGLGGESGFLGVQLTDLTSELRTHFGVNEDHGVMVSKVVDDSAAFRAGLQVGDVITRLDGEAVASTRDLTHAVRSREEGDTVNLEVWREDRYETLSATLDKQEPFGRFAHRVEIDCDDGDCECWLDGEHIDCEDLHTEHSDGN